MGRIVLEKVTKKFGETEVIPPLDLTIEDGEFAVFVGPSGCGKSTLLRLIAGLEETTSGRVLIDDQDMTEVSPSKRGLAMVFQSYALYPHMTVRKNIAFPMRMAGLSEAEQNKRVDAAAKSLNLTDYLDRKPGQLSGGQRQRVAIGRAIVRDPSAFLFDEPLSNLDAALRVGMRLEISEMHARMNTTMIYVTHDQVEAMTLADKIVVLRLGVIEQVGSPMELYRDPDNKFVAGFIGSPAMNFMDGVIKESGSVQVPALQRDVATGVGGPVGSKVSFGLRPEHITIDPAGSTHKVDMTESLGGISYAYLVGETGERIIVEERGDERSREGDVVGLSFENNRSYVFDAASEMRIR